MVVFQWITGYIVVYPRTTGYIVVSSPDNKSYHGNWLYSSMSPKTGYIVTFPPDSWLYGSISMDNWLYCCLSPGQLAIMDLFGHSQTVYRNMGGCKIYGRWGGTEPSIYFTNPPYFYRPSGTDQISVLFRLGPWIVYAITKISQKTTRRLHTYTAVFCARKYDVTACADDVIDGAVKIKDDTTLCVVKSNEKFDVTWLSNLSRVKAKLMGVKHVVSVSYAFRTYPGHQEIP